MMMDDELELDKLGDRKTALFCIVSDTDTTFNFIASMVYTQMFNTLCDKALENGGALKTHVTCLLDEFANQLKFNSTYILFYIQLSGWYSGEKGWRNDYKNGYGRAAI